VPKDYGIKQSGSIASSDTIYSVSFWLQSSRLLRELSFCPFSFKSILSGYEHKKIIASNASLMGGATQEKIQSFPVTAIGLGYPFNGRHHRFSLG